MITSQRNRCYTCIQLFQIGGTPKNIFKDFHSYLILQTGLSGGFYIHSIDQIVNLIELVIYNTNIRIHSTTLNSLNTRKMLIKSYVIKVIIKEIHITFYLPMKSLFFEFWFSFNNLLCSKFSYHPNYLHLYM